MNKRPEVIASKLGFYDLVPVLERRLTSIQQVNAVTGIPNSTIRYWERRCRMLRSESIARGERRRYRPDQYVLLLALHELVIHLGVTVDGAAAMLESLNCQGYVKDMIDRSQTSITRAELRGLLLSHMSNVFASPSRGDSGRQQKGKPVLANPLERQDERAGSKDIGSIAFHRTL